MWSFLEPLHIRIAKKDGFKNFFHSDKFFICNDLIFPENFFQFLNFKIWKVYIFVLKTTAYDCASHV